MHWVYASVPTSRLRKPLRGMKQGPTINTRDYALIDGLPTEVSSNSPLQRQPSPNPSTLHRSPSAEQMALEEQQLQREAEKEERQRLLGVHKTGVTVSAFSAEVDVTLSEKLKKDLLRSTLKNPPAKMRVDLIYVGPSLSPMVDEL